MERHTWLRQLINRIENHKETIYFCGMTLTLIFSTIAGFWVYLEYSSPLTDEKLEIFDVTLSPFVLGIFHFLIVFFLGSLISTTISMTHARRMKAFNLEVEFEAREHKEIKVGQAHYLSGILGNYAAVIGQFINKDNVSYRDVMEVICYHYRDYFTINFDRVLSYKIKSHKNSDISHSEGQLLGYIKRNGENVGFQNRITGKRTLLLGIATTMVPGEEEIVLSFQSDNNYEFDEYDVEAIRALIKYGDIVLQHLYFINE